MNPLRNIIGILQRGVWYDFTDLAVVVGFQMKLAGVDYSSNEELAKICIELHNAGFIEHHPTDLTQVKISEVWYGDSV